MVTPVGTQDFYRTTRSLEVQRAISHIGQAEYYARMALRSLEASEKAGRAPFFDYKRAREDLERISKEFRTYLGAEGSPARAAAVPLVIDGRYFVESIKDYLLQEKPTESTGTASVFPRLPHRQESVVTESPSESAPKPGEKESEVEKPKQQEQSALRPPVKSLKIPNDQTKRDKIEEILKKGL
jgi:hypothetical protein